MKTSSTYSHTFQVFEKANPCKDKLILLCIRNKKWKWWNREIWTVYSCQKQKDTEPSFQAWHVGAGDCAMNSHHVLTRVFNCVQVGWYLENLKVESGDLVLHKQEADHWHSELIWTSNPTSCIPNDIGDHTVLLKWQSEHNQIETASKKSRSIVNLFKWGVYKCRCPGMAVCADISRGPRGAVPLWNSLWSWGEL